MRTEVKKCLQRAIVISIICAIGIVAVVIVNWQKKPTRPSAGQPFLSDEEYQRIISAASKPETSTQSPTTRATKPYSGPSQWDIAAQRQRERVIENMQNVGGLTRAQAEQRISQAEHTAVYGPGDYERAKREESRRKAGW